MDIKEQSRQHFNDIAIEYDRSQDGKFVAPMYQEIVKRIRQAQPQNLLDIGCGTGNILSAVSHCNIKLFGMDLSDKMVDETKRRLGSRAAIIKGDAENLPYQSASMDYIVCNASFHHYPHPQKALSEMYRVLKPEGILLLGDPTTLKILQPLVNLFVRHFNTGDYKLYTKKDFVKLLKVAGFEMYDWYTPNYRTCIFNARKKETERPA